MMFFFISPFLSAQFNPLQHTDVLTPDGKDTLFVLSHRFVIPGSVRIVSDSSQIVSHDFYRLNHHFGELVFSVPPDSGRKISVQYRSIPVNLPLKQARWTVQKDTSGIDTPGMTLRQTRRNGRVEPFEGADLQRSGSIFRGISVGTNQGMRLQSGLRLQLSGNIAPNVEVVASLTDQNTPIQPEGNTQTLQEIDKVFITIKAPHFKATMGDFVYDSKGSTFSNYSRKLQGGMAVAENRHGAVTLMVAGSKGEFYTQHIQGQESNQGPYQLTGKTGQQDIIVLAGTERVFIDGEEMTRGEDNDYVIEYGLGQITFTRNRLITGDSRITVDFEYSDQKYQKTTYGAQVKTGLLDDRIQFQTAFLRESDNKNDPLDFVLTDEYRIQLENAGDGQDSSYVSGAKPVGENQGYYIKKDSLDMEIYQYVGENRGDYNVRFSHVGYGNGDYSFQGYGIYRFEGAGRGTYLPIIVLPAPVSHQTAGVLATIKAKSNLTLQSELSISDQDLNQFSRLDDSDNQGTAWSGALQLNEQSLRLAGLGLGRLSINGQYKTVGAQYRPMGRSTEIEHGRKWGVDEGQTWGETTGELEGIYRPVTDMEVKGMIGRFKRGALKSDRKSASAYLSRGRIKEAAFQSEWIESDRSANHSGEWLRQKGNLELGLWHFVPAVLYEGEHRKNSEQDTIRDGFRFDETTLRLGFVAGRFDASVEKSVRDDRIYQHSILEKNSTAETERLSVKFPIASALMYSMMYTRRRRDYADLSQTDQKSNLADAKLTFSPAQRFVTASLNYRFSSASVSEMIRDTIQVGAGFGNYRISEELNELVPDPDGDLLIRLIPTGLFLPVNDLECALEWQVDASKFWRRPKGIQKWLRPFKNRSRIRIERKDKLRDFNEVNRRAFNPSYGQDSTVVASGFSMHQDVEYIPQHGRFSLRFRFRKDDSENYQFAGEGQIRHRLQRGIRLNVHPARKIGILVEYEHEKESKSFPARAWSDRNITGSAWTLEGSFRPRQTLELALKTRYNRARDLVPDPATEVSSLFFLPRFELSFQSRGRLRSELEWGNVSATPDDAALPYEMLNGDQPGRTLRWTVLMTYRLTGHMQATLTWRGRQEPWRDRLFQMGQMEVRAFF